MTDILIGFKFNVQIQAAGVPSEFFIQWPENTIDKENKDECRNYAFNESETDCQPHACTGPEPGSGSKSHYSASHDDDNCTNPQKTDAADYLGAHTGDIDIGAGELIKSKFIDNDGQRGAHTDQGMGLNPSSLFFAFLSRPMIAPASVAIMRRAITEGMLHKWKNVMIAVRCIPPVL